MPQNYLLANLSYKRMKELVMTCTIIIALLVFMIVPIPWFGHHAFSLGNTSKNGIYKAKHYFFKVPLDRDVCDSNLKALKHAMDTIPFWLSEGTALGATREGDFIAHDDDVDIGIWAHDLKRFNKEALPRLRKAGFTLDFDLFKGTFMTLSRHGERLDVDAVRPGGECMAARTAAANCGTCNCIIPYLNDMRPIQIRGETYMVPGHDYLEYLYGSDWRTPKQTK
jgi:hypothetical protein